MVSRKYRGVCVLCDSPVHVQSLAVETVGGLSHEASALRLVQAAGQAVPPVAEDDAVEDGRWL